MGYKNYIIIGSYKGVWVVWLHIFSQDNSVKVDHHF